MPGKERQVTRKRPVARKARAKPRVWNLRVYVIGQRPTSVRAIENLKRICKEHLPGRYRIEVIDLLQQPRLARDDQIVAVPMVVRQLPRPIRKTIGDLSDTERALVGLQIRRK